MLSVARPLVPAVTVAFGAPRAALDLRAAPAGVRVPVPLLAGAAGEQILPWETFAGVHSGWATWSSGDSLLGARLVPVGPDLEESTRRAYLDLLAATRGRHLYRVWNYVPAINAPGPAEENYRSFCAGRARAFEESWGRDFARALPAASAVGCGGDELVLVFAAGTTVPEHFENDAQVPAYRYPPEHGRRPPSFSRATAGSHREQALFFISGTAAIRGHETVAPADFEGQLACTLENLRGISQKCGLGPDFAAADSSARRFFKVYLRQPGDLAAAEPRVAGALLRPGDAVTYLQADICRRALLVEIEATIVL